LLDWLGNNWREIGAGVAGTIALWRYLDTRRLELAWKRTEFLFSQAEKLDNDLAIQKAVRVLAGRDPNATVVRIFGPNPDLSPAERSAYIEAFEKLFNFLDRIAYGVLHVCSLTMQEVANFSWYFNLIRRHPCLTAYCESQGFPDVVRLAPCLRIYMEDHYRPDELGGAEPCLHAAACAAQQHVQRSADPLESVENIVAPPES